MKIKTFPLQFTEDRLNEIKVTAKDNFMSTKDFILEAIEEKMKKERK